MYASNMNQSFHHIPVLLPQTISALNVKPNGRYVDGTLGGGGHSEAILEASSPNGSVICIDRDQQAIQAATERLSRFGDRFTVHHGSFSQMASFVEGSVDGILLDLGVSSHQLDEPTRGFSFSNDGPVDMRMNQQQEKTAAMLLDELTEEQLANILYQYGQEPRSRRIARKIVEGRPWTSTKKLADCIRRASGYKNSKKHPATKSFQAIRIAVNDELNQLHQALNTAFALLKKGGRMAIISFHSIEDKIVKQSFRTAAAIGTPRDAYGHPIVAPIGRQIFPKGIDGKKNDPTNPRARSARLRVFEKTT